jgi:hypothetical protein
MADGRTRGRHARQGLGDDLKVLVVAHVEGIDTAGVVTDLLGRRHVRLELQEGAANLFLFGAGRLRSQMLQRDPHRDEVAVVQGHRPHALVEYARERTHGLPLDPTALTLERVGWAGVALDSEVVCVDGGVRGDAGPQRAANAHDHLGRHGGR